MARMVRMAFSAKLDWPPAIGGRETDEFSDRFQGEPFLETPVKQINKFKQKSIASILQAGESSDGSYRFPCLPQIKQSLSRSSLQIAGKSVDKHLHESRFEVLHVSLVILDH